MSAHSGHGVGRPETDAYQLASSCIAAKNIIRLTGHGHCDQVRATRERFSDRLMLSIAQLAIVRIAQCARKPVLSLLLATGVGNRPKCLCGQYLPATTLSVSPRRSLGFSVPLPLFARIGPRAAGRRPVRLSSMSPRRLSETASLVGVGGAAREFPAAGCRPVRKPTLFAPDDLP